MQWRAVRAAVVRGDADDQRVGVFLGHFDEDVEVAAVIEDAGIDQLKLGVVPPAAAVLVNELTIGKRALRIFVQEPLVRMARHGVEVEVALLHVLAVVRLGRDKTEKALLEDRIALVPEGQ